MDDVGRASHEQHSEDKRQADPDAPRLRRLRLRQSRRENGDEDEIVDAKHDLHCDKRDKGKPGRGIGGERQRRIHVKVSRGSAPDEEFPSGRWSCTRMQGKRLPVQGGALTGGRRAPAQKNHDRFAKTVMVLYACINIKLDRAS